MRLKISKSQNSTSLYVIKTIYIDGKEHTKTVEKLGRVADLEKKLNGQDPIKWARDYIAELNKREKEQNRDVIVKYSQSKKIVKDVQRSFNGGDLFLQQIHHNLGDRKSVV